MKKLTEEEKKKRKSTIGKIIAFVLILAISIAFSKYNFVEIGHDFVYSILSIAIGQGDEPETTVPPTEQSTEASTEAPESDENSTEAPDSSQSPEANASIDATTSTETPTE